MSEPKHCTSMKCEEKGKYSHLPSREDLFKPEKEVA